MATVFDLRYDTMWFVSGVVCLIDFAQTYQALCCGLLLRMDSANTQATLTLSLQLLTRAILCCRCMYMCVLLCTQLPHWNAMDVVIVTAVSVRRVFVTCHMLVMNANTVQMVSMEHRCKD